MKVSDLLESRKENWRELDRLCTVLEGGSRRAAPATAVSRFAALYRAVCADLALADAYQLPPGTIHFLHQLVGRAHNQLYRTRTFHVRDWMRQLFVVVPQRLFADRYLRLAFTIFWGVFLAAYFLALTQPGIAEQILGKEMIARLEDSFSEPVARQGGAAGNLGGAMMGFYVFNNPGIGLRCFAFGLLFGIGGLYATVANAAIIGASFGFMSRTSGAASENFFHFVTAHAPFELTAVVLCAAAGMRLGFSIVGTHGLTRGASLRRAGEQSLPIVLTAVILFVLAALIEAFLSPSAAPYEVKAAVALLSGVLLMFYFVFLGYPREGMTNDEIRMTKECRSPNDE
ncbi:MAG: stage II sporulation protein M [Pirellulales bacterium]|nr:stage II sporulation protein M [Pirellulales bacterium]